MDGPEEAMSMSLSGSSLGEGVSARGQNVLSEDYEPFYIPERRPSLDLGPSPMDTDLWHHVEQALSPAQSYKSMTSEGSNQLEEEDECLTRVQLHRADSYSSCYSFDSDDCEKRTPKVKVKEEDADMAKEDESETTDASDALATNEFAHPALNVAFTFKVICDTLKKLSPSERRAFNTRLWEHFPELFYTAAEQEDLVDLVDRLLECYSLEESLKITKMVLAEIKKSKIVEFLRKECVKNEVRFELREILRKKYAESDIGGEKRPFDETYTDPCISAFGNNGPNIEHEVMTIKKMCTNKKENRLISVSDIHAAEVEGGRNLKFVLLSGLPGSGKSTVVQRLILNWTEERSHQHVTFLFPFTFRELEQFKDRPVSLLSIINELYPPTTKLKFEDLTTDDVKVMLVFDGLDEYRDTIDFYNTELYGSFPEPTSLNVIVVNLLRGRILFRGLLLVTTRSQVKRTIPYDVHFKQAQVQGFSDPQKDEYFRKRFKDAEQADRVILYVKSMKTVHIMCHLPLFCSLIADECQRIFTEQGCQAELPKSLTYFYTKLMLVLMRELRSFRAPDRSAEDERNFVMDVGKMAFGMLEAGSFLVSKAHDWESHGVSDREAVDYSGLGTEFFITAMILYQEKAFTFIHPTMQEYIAALYVFLSFTNQGRMIFERPLKNTLKGIFKGPNIMELYKSALDRNLKCEDGKQDFFLRFLFGMLAKPNLALLESLCQTPLQWATAASDAAALIRKRMGDNQHPDRVRNLQHCLEELGVCD